MGCLYKAHDSPFISFLSFILIKMAFPTSICALKQTNCLSKAECICDLPWRNSQDPLCSSADILYFIYNR